MALTQAQLTTLRTNINADPVLVAFPNNSDGSFEIAKAYNLTAAPDFIVWKTDIPTSECKKVMIWTEFIGRSTGERDAWQFMLSNGTINGSDINIRQGISDIFSGASGLNSRTALLALAKRKATRAEKLFATGTGSDATPASLNFEGSLSYQNIDQARAA